MIKLGEDWIKGYGGKREGLGPSVEEGERSEDTTW